MDACYATLGLQTGVPLSVVKAKYKELALTCHPDKLVHASPEERAAKEEYFKEVTVAYHRILKGDADVSEKDIDWKNMWESFVNNKELWGLFKDVIKAAVTKAAEKAIIRDHHVKVPVTLEDVHMGRVKKLRLFLKSIKCPIFTELECDQYPSTCLTESYDGHMITINVTMVIKEHSIFTSDDLLNAYDLYADVRITIAEYFTGCSRSLEYLDGTQIDVAIEPFSQLDSPIVIKNKGLLGRGDIYVHVDLQLPSNNIWHGMSSENQQKVLNDINALYATNAHTSSGKPKTKTI